MAGTSPQATCNSHREAPGRKVLVLQLLILRDWPAREESLPRATVKLTDQRDRATWQRPWFVTTGLPRTCYL